MTDYIPVPKMSEILQEEFMEPMGISAYKLANATDLAWSPHGRFVELVLNGIHIGNYYLSEIRIKFDLDFQLTTKGKNQNSCPIGKPIHVIYVS